MKQQIDDFQAIKKDENAMVNSQYLSNYLSFMNIQHQTNFDKNIQIENFHLSFPQIKEIQKLKNSQIEVVQTYEPHFIVTDKKRSANNQVIELTVQVSHFRTKLTIYLNKSESCLHSQFFISNFGAFGNIYYVNNLSMDYAVKCIKFNSNENKPDQTYVQSNMQQILISAIKQYFFIQLFSVLEIGPKVYNIFGFDLIVHQNCIQFSTQLCHDLKDFDQKTVSSLKSDLKLMHSLKIVHNDIKPTNIMFSPSYKKNVFIDFGCCSIIEQKIGMLSSTKFCGTVQYCGPQMMKLVTNQNFLVDLYFNDIFGLSKTLEIYTKCSQKEAYQNKQQPEYYQGDTLKKQHNLLLLKNLCWKQEMEKLNLYMKIFYVRLSQEDKNELFKFFINLYPYQRYVKSFSKISSLINSQKKWQNRNSFDFFSQLSEYIKTNKIQNDELPPTKFKSQLLNQNYFENNIRLNLNGALQVKKIDKNFEKIILDQNVASILSNQQHSFYILKYISFTEQLRSQTFNKKVKACKIFLNLRQKSSQFLDQKKYLSYNINSQEWKIFVRVFKLVMKYGFKNEDFNKNNGKQIIQKIFKNYMLFYYQGYSFQGLFVKISWLHELNLKQRILLFWRCLAIFYTYATVVSNFKIQQHAQMVQKNQNFFQMFFQQKQKDKQYHSLARQNLFFHQTLQIDKNQNKNQILLHEVRERISDSKLFPDLSEDQYKQFRYNLLLCAFHIKCTTKWILSKLAKRDMMELILLFNSKSKYQNDKILSLSVLAFCRFYGSQKNFSILNKIFNFIDSIINFQEVSIRYLTNIRFQMTFYNRDIETLKKIMSLVSSLNVEFNLNGVNSHFLFVCNLLFSIQFIDFFIIIQEQRQYQKRFFEQLNQLLEKSISYIPVLKIFNFDQSLNKFNFKITKQIFQIQKQKYQIISSFLKYLLLFIKNLIQLNIQGRNDLIKMREQVQQTNRLFGSFLLQNCQEDKYLQVFMWSMFSFCLLKQNSQILAEMEMVQKHGYQEGSLLDKIVKTQKILLNQAQFFIFKIMRKIQLYNHGKQEYQDLIKFYNVLVKANYIQILFAYNGLLLSFCRAFVRCESSFSDIYTFFKLTINHLSLLRSKEFTQYFDIQVKFMLFCTCTQCYPFEQNFQPQKLVVYIYKKLIQQKQISSSFCLVYFYCLRNQKISTLIKKKFLITIYKNIHFVSLPIKQIILSRLYLYVFLQKNPNKKLYYQNKHLKHSRQQFSLNQIMYLRSKNITKNIKYKYQNFLMKLIKEKIMKKVEKYHRNKNNFTIY